MFIPPYFCNICEHFPACTIICPTLLLDTEAYFYLRLSKSNVHVQKLFENSPDFVQIKMAASPHFENAGAVIAYYVVIQNEIHIRK